MRPHDHLAADRQSRRDRPADHPHGAAHGGAHGGGLFRGRRRRAARARRPTRPSHRPAAGARKLSRSATASWRRAQAAGAEAIHPGYGFLSENAEFAEAVIAAGLVWVGPPPAAIRAMGLKDAAKRLMAAAGVPVTPGYLGEDQRTSALAREAAAIGWPVLIKAVAGGGGKGMRASTRPEDFAAGAGRRASARRRRPSATTGCCSKNYVPRRGTSRSRSSPTPTATWSTCSSATARCSAATRR